MEQFVKHVRYIVPVQYMAMLPLKKYNFSTNFSVKKMCLKIYAKNSSELKFWTKTVIFFQSGFSPLFFKFCGPGSVFGPRMRIHEVADYGSNLDPDLQHWIEESGFIFNFFNFWTGLGIYLVLWSALSGFLFCILWPVKECTV